MIAEISEVRQVRFNDNKLRNSFKRSKSPASIDYMNSIPEGLGIIEVYEGTKGEVKGSVNGFRFYHNHYLRLSGRFNIHDYEVDYDTFLLKIEVMFSVLHHLNKRRVGSYHVKLILEHLNEHGRYVFDVKQMYIKVRKFEYNPALVRLKKRDYVVTEIRTFAKKIEFLNAFNEARRIANTNHNLKELFCFFKERFENEDYSYLSEAIITGHKDNNLLAYAMVRKFNMLCTGQQRKRRKKFKSESLYCNSIKRLTLKAISLRPQQQNAFMQKGITKYEKELKTFNKLVNNRKIAKQMFLILADLTGLEVELEIIPDMEVQNQLKAELMNLIDKKASFDLDTGVVGFDRIYKKCLSTYLPLNTDLTDIFDTEMKNSIFNQLSNEEALSKGSDFYNDYMKFHKGEEFVGRMNFGILMPD